jgi:hypothetical protein
MSKSGITPATTLPHASTNEDVLRCVESQERLESLVPQVLFWSIFGIPEALILVRTGGRLTGGTIFQGILAFIAGRVAVAIAHSLFLGPSRNIRFKSAAKKLAYRLERTAPLTSRPCSWYLGAPGAFAITAAGELLLADRSTGFSILRLKPEQIVEAKVERDLAQITHTRHSGRTIVGGYGGGAAGGWISGGKSTSITRNHETAFLEIRYQLEPNGLVDTAIVPFGDDRRTADSACAMIWRLQEK